MKIKTYLCCSLVLLFFFQNTSSKQIGGEHLIKTNTLNLFFARPSLTYEVKLASKQSLSLTAYAGKIVFINLQQWRGAHLLYRYYLNKSTNLNGFYPSFGLNFHQKIFSNTFENHIGARFDIGYQHAPINRHFVWDVGTGIFASLFDNGVYKIEPEMRLNISIGYRIK